MIGFNCVCISCSQAIQILIGLIHIGFGAASFSYVGLSFYLPFTAVTGYPFWGGLFVSSVRSLSECPCASMSAVGVFFSLDLRYLG